MPNLLKHLMGEEKKRNEAARRRIHKALQDIPFGSIYIRKKKAPKKSSKPYVYLNFRVPGEKFPKSKYIGLIDSEAHEHLKSQLIDRARLEKELESLEIEYRMIQKALHEHQRARRKHP